MSKGLFSGLGAALSSGYGHSGYGHSGSGHSGYGHSGSSYGAIDKHSGYGGHQDHYGGHSGYGHSGGYHEEKCCPLVVDFLCLAAIIGAIAGAAIDGSRGHLPVQYAAGANGLLLAMASCRSTWGPLAQT